MAGLQSKHRWQIRRIFLMPRDRYDLRGAAEVLGIAPKKIVANIQAGNYDGIHVEGRDGGWFMPWSQVATIAVDQWSWLTIYRALDETVQVLPELVRPAEVTFTLPNYQWRMLIYLADRANKLLDDFLCDHLLDLAEAEAASLETEIPGFRSALLYPDEPTD